MGDALVMALRLTRSLARCVRMRLRSSAGRVSKEAVVGLGALKLVGRLGKMTGFSTAEALGMGSSD